MAGRLALTSISTVLALGTVLGALASPASALGEAPTVGAPSITAGSASSVQVSVSVDTHGSDTTVKVEYVTAGAYRAAARVPSAATTMVIATAPASDAGPVTVTGQVTGLDPESSYRMRVKASNVSDETVSADVIVTTPPAPRTGFRAKVGTGTTKITKLTVSGLSGGESAKVTCKTKAKGCPFATRTVGALAAGTAKLSSLLKGAALAPGAKVVIQVSSGATRLSTMTLVVRDEQQPKVKRK